MPTFVQIFKDKLCQIKEPAEHIILTICNKVKKHCAELSKCKLVVTRQ